ncbi:MAG: arginyltransferase [bacterium]|nr:arginyltransferase [bacterium]
MRNAVRESVAEEAVCSYLPDRRSMMCYRLIDGCSPRSYQRMLERGWRRFGTLFFRPGCKECQECRSLRVDVESFRPNRSMRRVWQKNQDLEAILQRPSLSEHHLALYERYHTDMARRKGWKERPIDPLDYFLTFVQGHYEFGYELLLVSAGRLVCVALLDILPRALSAVYCYYEPELRSRSLGVFSVLREIELARSRGLPHCYLGYWVEGNQSMRYKANYRPHQILKGRPDFDEQPMWLAPEEPP